MKIVTAHFDYPGNEEYSRCLNALTNSVKRNAPNAEFVVLELEPPATIPGIKQGWISNHVKLEAYSKVEIDRPTIFLDADTLVLKDPEQLFIYPFDIAIGRRPKGAKVPYNGGVVLFQPTEKAHIFMEQWIATDQIMLEDREFHMEYRAKYNGMNQASFGYLVDYAKSSAKLKEYPTGMINACEQDWPSITPDNLPFILHVRKKLFEIAHSGAHLDIVKRTYPHYYESVKLWREYEQK
jgi:alpha-N-acetylglucosamine transferase